MRFDGEIRRKPCKQDPQEAHANSISQIVAEGSPARRRCEPRSVKFAIETRRRAGAGADERVMPNQCQDD